MNKWFVILIFFTACTLQASAASLAHGPSTEIMAENNLIVTEDCRIRIENHYRGDITVSTDNGKTWFSAGRVLRPTVKTNPLGYTASKWSNTGCVSATAVNAIHIKTGTNVTGDFGVIFSLLPRNLLQAPREYSSYLSTDSSIYTSIWAGHSIFGGGYAPFVGSPVYLEQPDKSLKFLPVDYQPVTGDIMVIRVMRPRLMPKEIVFENRFGGLITMEYYGKKPKVIGQVLRPVCGAGRFLGSQYAYTGRIRANHSGVFDVSTAPTHRFGGFQILPANHGMSPEMVTARIMSQWMVVGPANVNDPSWENTGPLFSSFFRPAYSKDDLKGEDWMQKTLKRYLVQIKTKEQNDDYWHFFSQVSYSLNNQLPHDAMKVFDNISHIRILFPVYPDKWPY
ncbi:MAG: hypothetical protein ABIH39_08180 [Candidatus Margulisiibacteriota bacterium]